MNGGPFPVTWKVAYELPASEVTDGYLPNYQQIVTCLASNVPVDTISVANLYNAGTLSSFTNKTSVLFAETPPTVPGGNNGSSPDDETSFSQTIYKPVLAALPIIGWLLI